MRHEIARSDWETFFETFSRKNQGRLARIELTAPLGEGGPLLEEYEPLCGVTLGPNGEVPEIILRLGGIDAQEPRLTQVITDPTHVWVEGEAHGVDLGLVIRSAEEDETLLVFERRGAQSARAMGPAGTTRFRGRDRVPPERP
jgi:hypothetical protein